MIFFNFEPSVVNHTEESEQNGCEQNENTLREHLAICDQKIALIEADIKQSVTGTAKVVADVEKLSARYDPSFCIIQFSLYFECGLPFFPNLSYIIGRFKTIHSDVKVIESKEPKIDRILVKFADESKKFINDLAAVKKSIQDSDGSASGADKSVS